MQEAIENVRVSFPFIEVEYKTLSLKKFESENDDDGNLEYKRNIVNQDEYRLNKLATQMLWRMRNSRTEKDAIYLIGVDDDGEIVSQTDPDLAESLMNMVTIAKIIKGELTKIIIFACESEGRILEIHVTSTIRINQ